MIINAFGYEHDMGKDFNVEELEILENAPVVYILSGDTEDVARFVDNALVMDQTAFWTGAGECLVFCYEEMENSQYGLLMAMDIESDIMDRGQEMAA